VYTGAVRLRSASLQDARNSLGVAMEPSGSSASFNQTSTHHLRRTGTWTTIGTPRTRRLTHPLPPALFSSNGYGNFHRL
jgi:hypothetical protein